MFLDGVCTFCSNLIASFKTPLQAVVVVAFPMPTTGKVQRTASHADALHRLAGTLFG